MKHKELCQFCLDAVKSIGKFRKTPLNNTWALENSVRYHFLQIGFDEVLILWLEDKVIVAIDGSDRDLEEWLNNVDAYPLIDGCHNGFRYVSMRIKRAVDYMLLNCDLPRVNVGISRGGAIADIITAYSENPNDLAISAGAPRHWSFLRTKSLKHEHIRIASFWDGVPRLPSCLLAPFWTHYQTTRVRIKKIIFGKFSHTHYPELFRRYVK